MRSIAAVAAVSLLTLAGSSAWVWADDPVPAPKDPVPAPKEPAPKEPAPAPAEPAPKPKAPAVTVPTFENGTCPIMGKPSSRALFTETEKGRIYVCCPPCIAKIKADPERAYQAAYPVPKMAGNTVCPVTGETLGPNAVTVVLQGYEVGLVGPTCVPKARANAQVVLVKVLVPRVVDVGNLTCPVTGEAVADNAFCLVGDDLVRLSSPKCVADVKKDPVKALEAAKAIAARQAAAKKPAPGTKEGDGKPPAPTGAPPAR